MRFSVVIPVFNDVSALPEFLHRLFKTADDHGDEPEVVLVDDGSTEDIWQRLVGLKSDHPDRRVVMIRLARSHGQQPATLCGLLHCNTEFMVTLDADLQHPPEAAFALLRKLVNDRLDLVYGSGSGGHSRARRILSFIYRGLASLVGSAFFHASSLRAMRSSVVTRLRNNATEKVVSIDDFLRELLEKAGHVSFPHQKRRYGTSSYTWHRLITTVAGNAYHSRQLRPVAVRVAVAVSLPAAANILLGCFLLPLGISLVLIAAPLSFLFLCHIVTKRRRSMRLEDQFQIRETRDLVTASEGGPEPGAGASPSAPDRSLGPCSNKKNQPESRAHGEH